MPYLTLAVIAIEEDVVVVLEVPFTANTELVGIRVPVENKNLAPGKYIAMMKVDTDTRKIDFWDIEPYSLIQL